MTVSQFYVTNILGKDKDEIVALTLHLFEVLSNHNLVSVNDAPEEGLEEGETT